MDKKRFLIFSSFYLYSFTLLFLIMAILLWWFFCYQPLSAQINIYNRSNLNTSNLIIKEDVLNKELLRARGEVLYLNLKKREVAKSKGFSENNLSQELLNLVACSGATISFFRAKPWREKNVNLSCEVEIAIVGSYASCYAFLKNLSVRRSKVLSCALKPKEDNLIELTGVYKFYACNHEIAEKATMFTAKNFESLKSLFSRSFAQSERKKISKDNATIDSYSSRAKKRLQSVWLNLEDVPQVEYREKPRDYRMHQISKNIVVV